MATESPTLRQEVEPERIEERYVWEVPIRIGHWLGALSIVGLIVTGFYIAWPVVFSNGEAANNFLMGRVRQIHFACGYLFLTAFVLRLYWFFAGNNYARSGLPLVWRREWWHRAFEQSKEYLTLKSANRFIGHNQLGMLSYVLFIGLIGGAEILTGFAMYSESNPGGFWDHLTGWVIPLLGGSYRVHAWHHLFAWAILLFIPIHIYIVVLDGITMNNGLIGSIFTGRKFVRKTDVDSDTWIS